MKAVAYIAVGAALLAAGTAEAQQRHVRHNAASGYAHQAYAQRGPIVESRVQTWYNDTGWQGGYGPVEAYGYGYGYHYEPTDDEQDEQEEKQFGIGIGSVIDRSWNCMGSESCMAGNASRF